ncbi:unnamed protein product [Paramecium sonneborni]|uniref:Tubby C-terminal domain-containing protein n=1 Tax=Paramecium sonneborni TaxID=65129 RepID=A0A8S1PV39_9CILI|nr:unnamed protein product [Paramecium sonneborni]
MFLDSNMNQSNEELETPNICLDTLGLSQELDQQVFSIQYIAKQKQILKKNQNYTKNLGVGNSKYDTHDIDFSSFTIEKQIFKQEKKQSIGSVELNEAPQFFEVVQFDPLQLEEVQDHKNVQNIQNISIKQQCQLELNQNLFEQKKQEESQESQNQQEQKECLIEICDFFQETTLQELIAIPPTPPYAEKITQLQLPDYLKDFLINPIPNEGMFQCTIQRDKSGLNRFVPKYRMYWSHNGQFLLAAKKVLNKNKFIITQDGEFKKKEDFLTLGKVEQSKQYKGDYHLFDNGVKKKDQNQFKKLRTQLGSVLFDTTYDKQSRPRKIVLAMRKNEKETIQFISRKPQVIKNGTQKYYTLDFFGRVKKPSIKNFQLVLKNDDKDIIYAQFGKVNKNHFNLDFMSPLSPLIAMQLALSNLNFSGKS